MMRCECINLLDLLSEESKDSAQDIFSDNRFRRVLKSIKIDAGSAIEVLTDYIKGSGVRHHHISLISSRANLCIEIPKEEIHNPSVRGLVVACGDSGKGLLWLPKQPVVREWDKEGRIKWEQELDCSYESKDDAILIKARTDKQGCIEFPVIQFAGEASAFLEEIRTYLPQETAEYIKANWFRYQDVTDTWDYFIKGDIYDPRNQPIGRRWRCQQCAHTLYYHLNYLEEQTNKKIYAALQDLIAYSVMLSLPSDGRWRHGHWTHQMETHTRFQVDGIHLLLTHYEKTGEKIFLEKAKLATDYLISIADTLSGGGIWFLHDSLEIDEQQARLFYRNLVSSQAFGKSVSSTLCLNTHLWTLTALYRLSNLNLDQKYRSYLEKGLESAEKVLKAKSAQSLYSIVYGIRDFLLKIRSKKDNLAIQGLQRVVDKVLRRFILPYMKNFSPRLAMPNGFIERDLSFSALSDVYHIQNLVDLLVLYRQTGEKWILDLADKGIGYTLETGLARDLAKRDLRAAMFTEVLLMNHLIEDADPAPLVQFTAFLEKEGIPPPVDAFSCPLMGTSCAARKVFHRGCEVVARGRG